MVLYLVFCPNILVLGHCGHLRKKYESEFKYPRKKYSNLATVQIYKRIEKHVIAEDIVSLNLLITQLIEEKGIAFIEVKQGSEKIIEVGKKNWN